MPIRLPLEGGESVADLGDPEQDFLANLLAISAGAGGPYLISVVGIIVCLYM
jgi:hypothetical protein